MSRPHLILHIGLNKTGTSTIQHSLLLNQHQLRQAGFHLPDRLGRPDGGHHNVVEILRNGGAEAFVDHVRKQNTAPFTVVSAENFVEVFRYAPANAERLSKALRPHFDPKVVLFLRRQDYLKESVFAQVAKHHFQGSIQQYKGFLYDFVPFVDNLERAFGRENIELVIYRDDKYFDSWAAFCDVLGVSPIDYPASNGNTNSSLPRRKTLALSMMPKSSRRAADITIDVIRQLDCIHDDGVRWLMSPEERQQFLEPYLDGNLRICEQYAPDGSDFFCSNQIPRTNWFPPDPLSPQEWAGFAAALASRLAVCSPNPTPAK